MKDARLGQPLRFQLGHELPGNCRTLTALLERAHPELADEVPEGAQGRAVGRHGMIGKVSGHDATKPRALFRYGSVEMPPQFPFDRRELGPHAISPRLPPKLEAAAPGFPADMRE